MFIGTNLFVYNNLSKIYAVQQYFTCGSKERTGGRWVEISAFVWNCCIILCTVQKPLQPQNLSNNPD